ncbi:hypothetical protein MBLNU230_g7086t1 [Neophaeotheca triangularis]
MDAPNWPESSFPNGDVPFDSAFNIGQSNEEWEDWLRWDPAQDATSPENATSNSSHSQNDSPLQDHAFPLGHDLSGKPGCNDTLAPPMIAGEDALDLGLDDLAGNDAFIFSGQPEDSAGSAGFDFALNSQSSLQQPSQQYEVSGGGFNDAPWPVPSNTDLDVQDYSIPALTEEQMSALSNVALSTTTVPSSYQSPDSQTNKRTSSSSNTSPAAAAPPAPKKRGGRKRKAEVEQPSPENGGSQDGDEPPVKKTSHNVIEKRYRNNLNDKIVELRNSVPSLRAMGRSNGGGDEDLEGLTPAHKLNKATVMGKATEYIKHLEKRNKSMQEEMDAMKARLNAVEAAIGKTRSDSSTNSSPNTNPRQRQQSSASQQPGQQTYFNPATGNSAAQQQYIQQQQQPAYARPPNPPVEAQNQPQFADGRGGLLNKVMLGGMAGLMAMEGYHEHQQAGGDTSARGLLAAPVHLFRRGVIESPSSPAAFSQQALMPLLKMALIVGALIYLLAPLLTFSPRRKARPNQQRQSVRLAHVPSLASPVEVRRKAWLTAVQSVWVPKNFLLEVAAVTFKITKLSLRRLIGSETFTILAGTTPDDEAARIKAWDIAIDAQLAGGDAEVSYYRLLLTLMASGTLPDSPTRLMQKAVHFRVFFWEVANAGYGNLVMFKQFTEHVGKIYWDSARKLQKELEHAKVQGRLHSDGLGDEDETELLPDHLARLVELDCDTVLTDEMIQRAWNLAWNKASNYALATPLNAARDSVVEDHAIRSPLDAVAAWFAHATVDDTLLDSLSQNSNRASAHRRSHSLGSSWDTQYNLTLAVSVAPPASGALARALTAKALLGPSQNRGNNIIAALEALPPPSTPSSTNTSPAATASTPASMLTSPQAPASPDLRTALSIAKIQLLLATSQTPTPTPSQPLTSALTHLNHLTTHLLHPTHLTVLTAIGVWNLLTTLQTVSSSTTTTSQQELFASSTELLASNLRIWAGTTAGKRAGLMGWQRGRVVEGCLRVVRGVGGWKAGVGEAEGEAEVDSGYGSGSRAGSRGSGGSRISGKDGNRGRGLEGFGVVG